MEWNDTEGEVKRVYNGLGNRTVGIVQFDTTKRFLVAGDDFRIKFWEMDNVDLLDFSDAGGGLPVMVLSVMCCHISSCLLSDYLLPLISVRHLLVYDLTRTEFCWLFQQMRMVLKYLQMPMAFDVCIPLRIVQMMPPGLLLELL